MKEKAKVAVVAILLICLFADQLDPVHSVIIRSHSNQRDKMEMVQEAAEMVESEAQAQSESDADNQLSSDVDAAVEQASQQQQETKEQEEQQQSQQQQSDESESAVMPFQDIDIASQDMAKVQLSSDVSQELESMEYCDSATDLGNPIDDYLKGDAEDDVKPSGNNLGSNKNGRRCILRKTKHPKDNTFVAQEMAAEEAAEAESQSRQDKIQFRKMLMLDEVKKEKEEVQQQKELQQKKKKEQEKKNLELKKKDKEKEKMMEERVKLAEKVKQKAIAEAEMAKDEYLAMSGYKVEEPKQDDSSTKKKPKALAQKKSSSIKKQGKSSQKKQSASIDKKKQINSKSKKQISMKDAAKIKKREKQDEKMDREAGEKVKKLMDQVKNPKKKNVINTEDYKQSDGSYIGDYNLSEARQTDDTWAQIGTDQEGQQTVIDQETAETLDKMMKNGEF